jgi:hypothetical protein
MGTNVGGREELYNVVKSVSTPVKGVVPIVMAAVAVFVEA